jgi:hypothetical protein
VLFREVEVDGQGLGERKAIVLEGRDRAELSLRNSAVFSAGSSKATGSCSKSRPSSAAIHSTRIVRLRDEPWIVSAMAVFAGDSPAGQSARWNASLTHRVSTPATNTNRVCLGGEAVMRSIVLLALGVPIPIILLLAFCTHHF